jgi:cytochrome c biogenesis protein CcdA/thiol-disulfide isomerase/thioredoxin
VTVLLLAALAAGLATFLSPCVLPVLPVVLVGGAGGGRARPVGIAVGLIASFTLFTLVASRLLSALGLPGDTLRNLAIALLVVLGLSLLLPRVGALVGRPFHPLASWAGRHLSTGRREGFAGGLVLGVGLGALWTPCAGPILAAVSVLAAEQRVSANAALITLAYAVGAGVPLLAVALASQRATSRLRALREHAGTVRRLSGVALIAAAAVFTTAIPERLATASPEYTGALQRAERSADIRQRLGDLTDDGSPRAVAAAAASAGDGEAAGEAGLEDYGEAPELTGISGWLNTPDARPLTLAGLRGRVVLIDFWTYSCINCIRTLPYLRTWDARYRGLGLTIVGVHTPEFAFEHERDNVADAVGRHEIRYPVAIDNEYRTWRAWGTQYWPSTYLVDRRGHVRLVHFGEDDYGRTENAIRRLLGEREAFAATPPGAVTRSLDALTPETYLGSERGESRQRRIIGVWHRYRHQHRILNEVTLGGRWRVEGEYIEAGPGATLRLRYLARRAYVVLAPPPTGAVTVRVTIDDGPPSTIEVAGDDLYLVADRPGPARDRTLGLSLPPGTRAYSFTFG